MNLLDEIHQHLERNGSAKHAELVAALIDPDLIKPSKVMEDLNRLLRLGRVTRTKGDVYSATWTAA